MYKRQIAQVAFRKMQNLLIKAVMSMTMMTLRRMTWSRWLNLNLLDRPRLDLRSRGVPYRTRGQTIQLSCLARVAQETQTASCERSLSGTSRVMSTSRSQCQYLSSSRSINQSRSALWLRTSLVIP